MKYLYIGVLALLLVVSLETAYKFLSTPLNNSVSVGLTRPVYFTGWTKQAVGAGTLLLSIFWLSLIGGALRKPGKPKEPPTPLSGS